MPRQTISLENLLVNKSQEFFTEPIVLSETQIQKEISNREAVDSMCLQERQHAIDQLFPQRINGSLRGTVETFDTPFDF
jgi:hypothetical protein